jgi:hypothetical protein
MFSLFSCSTKKVLLKPTTTTKALFSTTTNILRQMSTEREQQVVQNLTQVREEVAKLKGNNTVSINKKKVIRYYT